MVIVKVSCCALYIFKVLCRFDFQVAWAAHDKSWVISVFPFIALLVWHMSQRNIRLWLCSLLRICGVAIPYVEHIERQIQNIAILTKVLDMPFSLHGSISLHSSLKILWRLWPMMRTLSTLHNRLPFLSRARFRIWLKLGLETLIQGKSTIGLVTLV